MKGPRLSSKLSDINFLESAKKNIMEHRFHTLDVFTTNRFEGNPLAVVTDGDGLSNDTMLAIAREMNLSETVFRSKTYR